MRLYFKPDCTLVIAPENSIEAMALKYWHKEFEEYGEKMLEVNTDAPIRLPTPDPN